MRPYQSRYVPVFLEEELYLYLLPEIPESTLVKYVTDEKERARIVKLAAENKSSFESNDSVCFVPSC